jgi:cytochrome d ubiquinol oxidase subunit I
MSSLTAARIQMEVSLGFHMIFAAIGMAMPVMMIVAERRWLRHHDADARVLAHTWAKLTAVTFAIGAVSGTALSFELGLLWPRFMAFAGPLIGPAFALEGYAFFVEAIFLGLYLYGWDRLSPRAHWLCGWGVAVSGALSGILVLATNAWMQHPVGFRVGADGMPADVNAWAVLTNPAWPLMAAHSTLSTYQAVGFAAAGAYAWALWRGPRRPRLPATARYQQLGLAIAMLTGSGAAFLQPVVGDLLAKRAHHHQPAKLAAMEGQFVTERGAPLRIGGIPDVQQRETRYALEIPGMLSFLADHDVTTEVAGLDRVPRDEWPNVVVTHVAFQIMVAAGVAMLLVSLWYWWIRWRRRTDGIEGSLPRGLLFALVLCAPLGFIALEAGWIVTEVGRQPWVIYRVMRTADAVTPVADVWASLALFTSVYAALLMLLVFFLRRLAGGGATAAPEH